MTEPRLTKAALLAAQRAELGKCVSLTDKGTECTHWAVERVNSAGYCGQHIAGIVTRAAEAKASAGRKARMIEGIDAYLEKTGQAAHVCGEVCYFSVYVLGPKASELQNVLMIRSASDGTTISSE